jgi:small subunit ribosomal protein S1
VTNITKFGAFVQISEGAEGMIHISEISAEKRISHPQEVLRLGQVVKAQVIAIDLEKRNMRLSMKQLVPSILDEYILEHQSGDVVTGRIVEISGENARVELGEGVSAACRMDAKKPAAKAEPAPVMGSSTKADLSSLGSMLQARWKSGSPAAEVKPEAAHNGEIRKFRITNLDKETKKIELELA